ncbi:hypothetical protein BDR07DRAFT_885292 [Suillus spraguei]|nr:hypothetical protein BDR07DRAFT_885292 [Suillus spraguei]
MIGNSVKSNTIDYGHYYLIFATQVVSSHLSQTTNPISHTIIWLSVLAVFNAFHRFNYFVKFTQFSILHLCAKYDYSNKTRVSPDRLLSLKNVVLSTGFPSNIM